MSFLAPLCPRRPRQPIVSTVIPVASPTQPTTPAPRSTPARRPGAAIAATLTAFLALLTASAQPQTEPAPQPATRPITPPAPPPPTTTYQLRGPVDLPGREIEQSSKLTLGPMRMNLFADGGVVVLDMTTASDTTERRIILDTDQGITTLERRRIISQQRGQRVGLDNRVFDEQVVKGPLDGATILGRREGDQWVQSLEQGELSPEQAELLAPRVWVDEERVVYPERGISIGEVWAVDDPILGRLMGTADDDSGNAEMTLKLLDVRTVNGDQQALIQVVFRLQGQTPFAGGLIMPLRVDLEGRILRSISRGLDLEMDLVGSVQLGPVPGPELGTRLGGSGPMRMEVRQTVLRPGGLGGQALDTEIEAE